MLIALLLLCAGFAKWQLAVTQRHEDEPSSSSIYNQPNLGNPAVSMPTFVNKESIRNKDLVVWVTSGLYHIPSSEDAPSTPTIGNHLGFMLTPFNMHDENAATDMADFMQIDKESNKGNRPPSQEYAAKGSCTPKFDIIELDGSFEETEDTSGYLTQSRAGAP